MKLRTVWLGLLLGISLAAWAQADTLYIPSMREVYKQNNWLSGCNPIGLSFNRFNSFSIAEVGYRHSSGNLGNASLPTHTNVYSVESEAFQTLGKVALYGKIGYVLNRNQGQNWNGMTNDYWQAVSLCDSISGKRRNETYHLAGAFSLPLYSHWIIGAKMDYRVQMTAKDTDPRNKNQWMEWRSAPGIGYKSEHYTLGISLLYANRKETVDYQNMGTHATYPFFAGYPLGFFQTLSRDGNLKWYYMEHEVGGALQWGFNSDVFRLFQELGGSAAEQTIESNRIQSCKEGETNLWQMNYSGKLQKLSSRVRHDWRLNLSYEQADNYDPLQQQEESGVWKSYGRVLRSTRRVGVCELDYEYSQLRDVWHPRYSLLSGVRYRYQERALLFYPIKYMQPLHRFTLYAAFMRNYLLPDAFLDCSLGGEYGMGGGTIMKERTFASGQSQSTEEVKLWQKPERLQQDFDYETAARWRLNFSVTYTRKIPFCWFFRLSAGYGYLRKCELNENDKTIVTQIGLIF